MSDKPEFSSKEVIIPGGRYVIGKDAFLLTRAQLEKVRCEVEAARQHVFNMPGVVEMKLARALRLLEDILEGEPT